MGQVRYPELARLLHGKHGQRAIAKACGVSQPSVSAWFRGTGRPNRAHTAILARILGIPPAALAAAAEHPQIPFDFEAEDHRQSADAILHHVRKLLEDIRVARDTGSPQLALNLCEQGYTLLHSCAGLLNNGARVEAAALTAHLLMNRGRILCECLSPYEAAGQMREIASQLGHLAIEINDSDTHGFQLTTSACIEYVQGHQRRSLGLNLEAIELVEEPHWRLDIGRAITISAASLALPKIVVAHEGVVRRIVDKLGSDDPASASFAFEGLGRAHALLRRDSAIELIETARRLHDNNAEECSLQPRRTVQLLRSYAMALARLDVGSAAVRTKVIDEAIALADLHGYARYSIELMKLREAV